MDATDLDPEDIPDSRINGVTELLRTHPDDGVRLMAARLLTSWGVQEGLSYTVYIIDHFQAFEGFDSHRLHGHDETLKFVLRSLVGYFCRLADAGEGEKARAEIYAPREHQHWDPLTSALLSNAASGVKSALDPADTAAPPTYVE